jgi:hypothetical protein
MHIEHQRKRALILWDVMHCSQKFTDVSEEGTAYIFGTSKENTGRKNSLKNGSAMRFIFSSMIQKQTAEDFGGNIYVSSGPNRARISKPSSKPCWRILFLRGTVCYEFLCLNLPTNYYKSRFGTFKAEIPWIKIKYVAVGFWMVTVILATQHFRWRYFWPDVKE